MVYVEESMAKYFFLFDKPSHNVCVLMYVYVYVCICIMFMYVYVSYVCLCITCMFMYHGTLKLSLHIHPVYLTDIYLYVYVYVYLYIYIYIYIYIYNTRMYPKKRFLTHSWHTTWTVLQQEVSLPDPNMCTSGQSSSAFVPRQEQSSLQWATPTSRSLQALHLNRSAPSQLMMMDASDYDGRISQFLENFSEVVPMGLVNTDVADAAYTNRSMVSHASADLILTPRTQTPTHLFGVQRESISAHLPIFIRGPSSPPIEAITACLEPAITVFQHSRVPYRLPSGASCPSPYPETSQTPVVYNIHRPPPRSTVRPPPRTSSPQFRSPNPSFGYISPDRLGYAWQHNHGCVI